MRTPSCRAAWMARYAGPCAAPASCGQANRRAGRHGGRAGRAGGRAGRGGAPGVSACRPLHIVLCPAVDGRRRGLIVLWGRPAARVAGACQQPAAHSADGGRALLPRMPPATTLLQPPAHAHPCRTDNLSIRPLVHTRTPPAHPPPGTPQKGTGQGRRERSRRAGRTGRSVGSRRRGGAPQRRAPEWWWCARCDARRHAPTGRCAARGTWRRSAGRGTCEVLRAGEEWALCVRAEGADHALCRQQRAGSEHLARTGMAGRSPATSWPDQPAGVTQCSAQGADPLLPFAPGPAWPRPPGADPGRTGCVASRKPRPPRPAAAPRWRPPLRCRRRQTARPSSVP